MLLRPYLMTTSGARFSPASLGLHIWLDVNDSSQLFQGIGGDTTTPAGVGDLVGTILNKGSLGGYFSSTTTSNRPTLAIVNGKRFLSFTGGQNSFGSAAILTFSNAVTALGVVTSFILPDATPVSDGQIFSGTVGASSRINIASKVSGRVSSGGKRTDADTVQDTSASGATLSDNTLYSLVSNYNYNDAVLNTFLNNTSYADKIPFQTTGSTSSTDLGAIAIGRFAASVGSFLNGYLGPVFARQGSVFTVTEMTQIDAYIRF